MSDTTSPATLPPVPAAPVQPVDVDALLRREAEANGWWLFRSLQVEDSADGEPRQIDFALLMPDVGMALLQVRGGNLLHKEGIWYQADAKSWVPIADPWDQALDTCLSLQDDVQNHFKQRLPIPEYMAAYCPIAAMAVLPGSPVRPSIAGYEPLDIVCATLTRDTARGGQRSEAEFLSSAIRHNIAHRLLGDKHSRSPTVGTCAIMADYLEQHCGFEEVIAPAAGLQQPTATPEHLSGPATPSQDYSGTSFPAMPAPDPAQRPQFFAFQDLLPRLTAGTMVRPQRSWRLFAGGAQLRNIDILNPYNIAPLVAWWGEQIWSAAGQVLGGHATAALKVNLTSTFGCRLEGFWANNEDAAVVAFMAGLTMLDHTSGDLDEVANRFTNKVANAKLFADRFGEDSAE
jgi:hypothetical protein